MDERHWTILVPVKRLAAAKSRLRTGGPSFRPMLALAFAMDAITAAAACPLVRRVAVVTADPVVEAATRGQGLDVLPQGPVPGLNEAIRYALGMVETGPVAIMTADLPALRDAELFATLAAAAEHPLSFVPDTAGTGTVLLAGASGPVIDPSFGPDSAGAHERAGAFRLPGRWPGLRRDVDTPTDLTDAIALGVGCHTSAVLSRRQASTSTV